MIFDRFPALRQHWKIGLISSALHVQTLREIGLIPVELKVVRSVLLVFAPTQLIIATLTAAIRRLRINLEIRAVGRVPSREIETVERLFCSTPAFPSKAGDAFLSGSGDVGI